MRALMIAGCIWFFCFSADIVNQVEIEHFAETGRPIFGWSIAPPIHPEDIEYFGSEAKFNATMRDYTTPQEQPTGLSLDSLISTAIFIFKAGWIFLSALFNSTIGVIPWLHNLGRSDFVLMPWNMAGAIGVGIYFAYGAAIFQWWTQRDARAAA